MTRDGLTSFLISLDMMHNLSIDTDDAFNMNIMDVASMYPKCNNDWVMERKWREFMRTFVYDFFKCKKIIFNNPATIVIWEDHTKTIVKCQTGETFDPEKGLALCFMKKCLGNKGNFNNILKKEISKDYFLEEYDRLKNQGKTESQIAKELLGDWATVPVLRARRSYELKNRKLQNEKKGETGK